MNEDELGFYKNIFNELARAVLVVDVDNGRIIDANKEASNLFKIEIEELLKLRELELHPPIYNDTAKLKFNSYIKDLLDGTDVEAIEHTIVDSTGLHIPVEITPRLVKYKDKKYIVSIFKDLRSIKFHENILFYYDKALEKSSSLLAFVDTDYVYRFANNAYYKIFNKTSSEIIGKKVHEIVGSEYFYSTVKERLDRALAGESVDYEAKLVRNDKTHYLQVYYEPYYSIDNEIIGIVASVYDLTKFREYEQESYKKEKLMIHQSKMAAMGEMLENIAHQWRQPLSVISTCSSGIMLQKEFNTLEDDFLDESLKTVMDTTAYLSNTIDDFKNFFERDREKTKFSLKQVTNKALDLVEVSLKESEIEIIKEFIDDISIVSYKSEFMQVLLNLINNAKDAHNLSQDNEKKKIIKVKIYKNKNRNSVIEIQDNAGGIPEEIIEKIFEPYFTTKHKSQGTGIGLFMTRQIITNHMQGQIEVNNKEIKVINKNYKGAIFKIIFI